MAKFNIGDRVRVKITGKVGQSQEGYDMQSTTSVLENSGGRWSHYLYLGSSSVIVGPDGQGLDQSATAEFNAVVAGDYLAGKNSTTMVQELSTSGNATGCRHFIYIDSDCVVKLEQFPDGSYRAPGEKPPPVALSERATETVYKTGDMIRVAMDVEITSTSPTGPYGCGAVRETAGGKWTHYVFLSSRFITGNTGLGGMAHVEFTGKITGPVKYEDSVTTQVQEIRDDGIGGYNHSLYVNSAAITRIGPDDAGLSDALAEAIKAQSEPELKQPSKKGTTVSIDRYDDEITYRQVEARIEELDEATETSYEVIRVRNDEVLATEDDEDDARQYIEDNDYDPERVIVRETDPDEEDVNELSDLGALNSDCESNFGSAWTAGDVTLYRDDYFDSDWARQQAADALNIRVSETDEWPLNNVDWTEAAELRRDEDYTLIDFDGAEFYGADQ